jgi:ectoine hydroxylase-related dioxygenase (phytanoyl-CoA dioxygenase family)
VVIKHAGIAEGLSDLPWHRDCGLGGHPLTCPTVNVGIQLDAATAETGRLLFLAGSWDKSCHRGALGDPDLPIVGVDTEPGDCTVHLGDVLHAAPPPTGTGCGRRALYVTFMPPRAFDFIPAGQSYNDVIRARVGGQAT